MANDKTIPFPSEREQIRVAAKRWHELYGHRPDYPKDVKEIQKRLDALDGETATIEDINAIFAQFPESQAYLHTLIFKGVCEQCGKHSYALVTVGEEEDWESRTATLCEDCLRAALAVLQKGKQ